MGSTGVSPSKVVARLASVGVDEASNAFLHDCFKQFGIHVVPIQGEVSEILGRQKFEACVLRLYTPEAEEILRAARNSSSNRRMVIYGIARNTLEALRFSSYGINAIFDEPLERQGVLRVVRSTHLLVIHELRRYVRIPVVTEASIDAGGTNDLAAASVEVSAGGMSVSCPVVVPAKDMVRISFVLPGEKQIKVRATVCWSRPRENLYGLRFDASDDARLAVRNWIDQYLELM
ncbi:MAG TPA: PilZ domain-containing protein [Candidatus Angelobacter sp.]|nr:PilZ domain-containing protein [Candidatus Angelobacter sp.]